MYANEHSVTIVPSVCVKFGHCFAIKFTTKGREENGEEDKEGDDDDDDDDLKWLASWWKSNGWSATILPVKTTPQGIIPPIPNACL